MPQPPNQKPSQNSRRRYASSARRRRKSKLIPILMGIAIAAAVTFFACLYLAVSNQIKLRRMANDVASYTSQPTQTTQTTQTAPTPAAATAASETAAAAPTAPTEPPEILPQFQELVEQNSDLAGWLTIDGTPIDYPVMYSPNDPERYLHKNFDRAYSFAGLPFIDASCQVDQGNRIIYAHNMLDGSMFRSLLKYEQKNFWEAHPTIQFSTLYQQEEYEVVAAFYDHIYKKTDTNFKFYQFYDTTDEDHFNEALAHFAGNQLYETGVEAKLGDHLLTLVTCSYHTDNGRFVVIARKK